MPSPPMRGMSTTAEGTVDEIDGRYVLRFERRLHHSRAKVWDALTRPERLRDWFGESDIELELVEGGRFELRTTGPTELVEAIIEHGGEEALVQHNTVLRVDPPAVFEHTFGAPDSVVRWELQEDGDGCRLSLTHTEPPSFSIVEHGPDDFAGWHMLLELLAHALDGHPISWRRERWQELRDAYVGRR